MCESPVPGARATQSERRAARAGAERESESAAAPRSRAPPRTHPRPRRPRRPQHGRLAPGPATTPDPGACCLPPSCRPRGGAGLARGCHSGSSEPPAVAAPPPPPGTATMNPQCARCGKVVYPTEKVNCLDKVSEGRRAGPDLPALGCTCSEKFWHLGRKEQSGTGCLCGLGPVCGHAKENARGSVREHAWRWCCWNRNRLLSGCGRQGVRGCAGLGRAAAECAPRSAARGAAA